jgi:hypothetical protein
MIPVRATHGVTSGEHRQDTRRMVKLAYFLTGSGVSVSYHSCIDLVNLPTNTLSRRGGKGESKAGSCCSKEVERILKERCRQASHIQTSRGSIQQGVSSKRSYPVF